MKSSVTSLFSRATRVGHIGFLGACTAAFCLVGVFPHVALAQPPVARNRVGVATNRDPRDYAGYTTLGMGWYHNWGPKPWSLQTIPGVEFVPMVGTAVELWGRETEVELRTHIQRAPDSYPPGTIWIVGNELTIDRFDTINGQPIPGGPRSITPQEYAQKFRKYYAMIKGINPTYRIGVGHTYLSWEDNYFLRDTRLQYQSLYGTKMPIEVYTLHTYWPSWNPSDDLTNVWRQVTDMRQQMLEYGDRDRPLVITELGSLSNPGAATVSTFMTHTFDYLNSWTSDILGCPNDGNRMVQKWAWFALTSWDPSNVLKWQGTDLFEVITGTITALGVNYAAYPKAPPSLPCAFWGSVSADGSPLPDGTVISAWITGTKVAQSATTTYNGSSVYTMDVPADDPAVAGIQGGQDGVAVRFRIGTLWAAETGTWQEGDVNHVNLTAAPASYFAVPSNWLANFGTQAGGWSNNNSYPRALADVNGDGRADVVGFGAAGAYVALSTGSGFAAPALWIRNFGASAQAGGWTSFDSYPRLLGDFDGDGRADIAAFGAMGTYVALSTGASFGAPVLWIRNFGTSPQAGGWTSFNAYPRAVADANGDGRADVVGFGALGAYVALSTGSAFGSPALWIRNFGAAPQGGGWTSYGTYPRMLADADQDGKADIVGMGGLGIYVARSTGSAFVNDGRWCPDYGASPAGGGWTSQNVYPRIVADVNGDERADLVGFRDAGTWVSLSSGSAFGARELWLGDLGNATGWASQDIFPRTAADVDGDGRADAVGFGAQGVMVALSKCVGCGGGSATAALRPVSRLSATRAHVSAPARAEAPRR